MATPLLLQFQGHPERGQRPRELMSACKDRY